MRRHAAAFLQPLKGQLDRIAAHQIAQARKDLILGGMGVKHIIHPGPEGLEALIFVAKIRDRRSWTRESIAQLRQLLRQMLRIACADDGQTIPAAPHQIGIFKRIEMQFERRLCKETFEALLLLCAKEQYMPMHLDVARVS